MKKGVSTTGKQPYTEGCPVQIELLTRQKYGFLPLILLIFSNLKHCLCNFVITEHHLTPKTQGPDGKPAIIKSVQQIKKIYELLPSKAKSVNQTIFSSTALCLAMGCS